MSTLLHIDSSLSPFSTSRAVAAEFVEAWQAANPGSTILYRDLVTSPPPHLTWDSVTASQTPPDAQSPEQVSAWQVREELIAELEQATDVVISAPMYNWAVPSSVKAWIDNVIAVGRTVNSDKGTGVLTGKPVTFITGRGGAYGPGTPMEGKDHQEPYLRQIAEALGASDIEFIHIELTMAAVNPAMEHLKPLAAQSREAAAKAVSLRASQA